MSITMMVLVIVSVVLMAIFVFKIENMNMKGFYTLFTIFVINSLVLVVNIFMFFAENQV